MLVKWYFNKEDIAAHEKFKSFSHWKLFILVLLIKSDDTFLQHYL